MARADHHERGERHQAELARRGRRRRQGAFYTPPDVVDRVLDLVLQPGLDQRVAAGGSANVGAIEVLDPACGTGNFLVAAHGRVAEALERGGMRAPEARRAALTCLHGMDIDPDAVTMCRAALVEAGGDGGSDALNELVHHRIRCGDALVDGALGAGRFDVVVGNPPFLGQLSSGTARPASDTARLRRRFGSAIAAYTDPAWVFLLVAVEAAAPGGQVALVQPASVLAARDAAPVRDALATQARLRSLWVVDDRVFDAAVDVVVPVLDAVAGPAANVELRRGPSAAAVGSVPPPTSGRSWAPLLAAARAVPAPVLATGGALGDIADATADFRDQYYGLAGHLVDRVDADHRAFPPVVTVGSIDPASSGWGVRPTRLHKQRWLHPRIDVEGLAEPLRAWVRRRQVPKVLVATQTRIPEALVDEQGTAVGSVPVITVTPRRGDVDALWSIGAVLTCPPVAAVACARHAGTGRNAASLRLRAADVAALPLPADVEAWNEGAAHLRRAHRAPTVEGRRAALGEVARSMSVAYGLGPDDPVVGWWSAQLPWR
jgi:SAM-dependent methyltransferase